MKEEDTKEEEKVEEDMEEEGMEEERGFSRASGRSLQPVPGGATRSEILDHSPLLARDPSLFCHVRLVADQGHNDVVAPFLSHLVHPLARIFEGFRIRDVVYDHCARAGRSRCQWQLHTSTPSCSVERGSRATRRTCHRRVSNVTRYETSESLLSCRIPKLETNHTVVEVHSF
jgi:hypothetical protein